MVPTLTLRFALSACVNEAFDGYDAPARLRVLRACDMLVFVCVSAPVCA